MSAVSAWLPYFFLGLYLLSVYTPPQQNQHLKCTNLILVSKSVSNPPQTLLHAAQLSSLASVRAYVRVLLMI